MSYFDPKEEVIDLKLTPHGEHLLSIGKLEPAFYAFFDNVPFICMAAYHMQS